MKEASINSPASSFISSFKTFSPPAARSLFISYLYLNTFSPPAARRLFILEYLLPSSS